MLFDQLVELEHFPELDYNPAAGRAKTHWVLMNWQFQMRARAWADGTRT
jgi:hypothetical protein